MDLSDPDALADGVIARRVEGNRQAVGTIWDGVSTARLGVAYGFLNASTGALVSGSLDAEGTQGDRPEQA